MSLLELAALIGMVGLVLGLGAGPARRPDRAGRSRWASVLLAGLVGMVAAALYLAPIPYLVLIAIEHVRDAMPRGPLGGAGVARRIAWATPAAVMAVAACLVAAVRVSQDAGRASGPGPGPSGRRPGSLALSLAPLILAVASSGYLLLATLPMLSGPMASALWQFLGWREIATIVAGFVGLAAGLAARAAAPGHSVAPHRGTAGWIAWIVARLLLVGVAILYGLSAVADDWLPIWFLANPTGMPASIQAGAAALVAAINATVPHATDLWPFLGATHLLPALALAWVVVQILRLGGRSIAPGDAPLDDVLSRPESARRFVWIWSSMSLACLASLPMFAVGGLVLLHHLLNLG